MSVGIGREFFEKQNQSRVMLVGHGMWVPGDGWITVPQGKTVHFYVHDGNLLDNAIGNTIEGFTGTGTVPQPVESVHGGGWIRNYRLTYASGLSLNGSRNDAKYTWITVRENNRTIPLSTLFRDTRCVGASDLHWVACREIKGQDKVQKYKMGPGGKVSGAFPGGVTYQQ